MKDFRQSPQGFWYPELIEDRSMTITRPESEGRGQTFVG